MPDPVVLIANGDLRLAANQKCWPAQARAEEAVMGAIRQMGREMRRHPDRPDALRRHLLAGRVGEGEHRLGDGVGHLLGIVSLDHRLIEVGPVARGGDPADA